MTLRDAGLTRRQHQQQQQQQVMQPTTQQRNSARGAIQLNGTLWVHSAV